jgi:ABC-type nitrate/sulfonate/bicarbonate transport system substrate-binding protein
MVTRCRGLLALAVVVGTIVPAMAQETVRFGVQPATQPIFIAKALGFISQIEKKHNIRFEWPNFTYGAPQNQAFAAGELELSSAGMGPAVIAAARLPGHLIAIDVLEQTALIVPKDSTATSVADLKGKTIAFPGEGSQQYPLLLKALQDAGMSATDVKLFKANAPNIGQLVTQKDVDAGIIWDPHVSNALASGKAKVLLKAEKIMPIKENHYVGNGTYVRSDFMKKRPELVQDVVNALVASIDFINAEPKKAAEMWSKEIGFPIEVINYSLSNGISFYSRNVVPDRETLTAYTSFLKAAGILQKSDEVKAETSFAVEALTPANKFAKPR